MFPSPGRSPRTRGSRRKDHGQRGVDGSIPAYAGEPSPAQIFLPGRGVDPRVRGGARSLSFPSPLARGRSPRTRGSLKVSRQRHDRRGSIPAYAGEPCPCRAVAGRQGVDPRVRGGACRRDGHDFLPAGRSPRTRGSLLGKAQGKRRGRSIPAYAGEPLWARGKDGDGRVDPRVRGGATINRLTAIAEAGRSPRTRGSQVTTTDPVSVLGSIPAYAGEPVLTDAEHGTYRVDPRVRGGASVAKSSAINGKGRSPRTRGSREPQRHGHQPAGSIPAYAGEPKKRHHHQRQRQVDPRVRGGAVRFDLWHHEAPGRSPRTRGSPSIYVPIVVGVGSIPAYAGEPHTARSLRAAIEVDPRVRGGARRKSSAALAIPGRSPRTRGSPI